MSAFTPEQERRLREIVREELSAERVWQAGFDGSLPERRRIESEWRQEAIRTGRREGLGLE